MCAQHQQNNLSGVPFGIITHWDRDFQKSGIVGKNISGSFAHTVLQRIHC
jgi:hypothetical protein